MHTRLRRPLRVLAIALAMASLALGCGKYGPPTRTNASPASSSPVSAGRAAAEDCEDEKAPASPARRDVPEAQP